MGWVTRAMIKILTISLGISPYLAVGICFVITVAYSVAAGLWAVLWTDLIQFVIKMSAVIVLAIYSVKEVGGMDALIAGVSKHFGSETAALSVLPVKVTPNGLEAYAWMPLLAPRRVPVHAMVGRVLPRRRAGGGGYVAQRIFSAKTERDGVLATLFFQVAHYALRPWPWIITGLATVICIRRCRTRKRATCTRSWTSCQRHGAGFMLAGFAAAYMSTIGTHLNWGASYLVNDFYKRFMKKDAADKHYVNVGRAATILLFLASIIVTSQLSSVEKAWKFLLAMGAGTGLVLILRWYWWRINAWSEISAMVVVVPRIARVHERRAVAVRSGRSQRGRVDHDWHGRRHDGDVGGRDVPHEAGTGRRPGRFLSSGEAGRTRLAAGCRTARLRTRVDSGGALAWTNWIAGIVAVYYDSVRSRQARFSDSWGMGLGLLAVAVIAFAWIARSFRSDRHGERGRPRCDQRSAGGLTAAARSVV